MAKTEGPNPIDVIVGHNVRKLRTIAGMSQETLGTALGITFQQVQKYEKGSNRISASRLVMISKVLNVHVMSLFQDAVDVDVNLPTSAVPSLSKQALKLGYRFDRLRDPGQKKSILALVSTLGGEPQVESDELEDA